MDATENQIVVYQPNETVRLNVWIGNETMWLTQEQIANFFGTKRPAIIKHLANIYKSGELEREGTCSIWEHMGNGGKQSYFTSEHYDKKHVPHCKISDVYIKTFNDQCPKLAVRHNEPSHDRFLVIDDKELHLIDASLKDLGSKCFCPRARLQRADRVHKARLWRDSLCQEGRVCDDKESRHEMTRCKRFFDVAKMDKVLQVVPLLLSLKHYVFVTRCLNNWYIIDSTSKALNGRFVTM